MTYDDQHTSTGTAKDGSAIIAVSVHRHKAIFKSCVRCETAEIERNVLISAECEAKPYSYLIGTPVTSSLQ